MTLASFADLTPDRILAAVDETGCRATGRTTSLGALENRVFEAEREDGSRVVVKFYRPGRHSTAAILDEHRLLLAFAEAELPAVPPLRFSDGETLRLTPDGHRFAVFPKARGRSPDELTVDDHKRIGRLLAQFHNVSESLSLPARPTLSPATYGTECLEKTLRLAPLPPGTRGRYEDAARRLTKAAALLFQDVPTFVVHADCHRGNVLNGADGFFFLDFDDAAHAPAVQDLWLLLPGRPADCPAEVDAWIHGYETFRTLDSDTLSLVEALRGLRYIRYAAWIAERRDDPAFARAFPHAQSASYWEGIVSDLHEQLTLLGAG